MEVSFLYMLLNLLVAAALGGVIGYEREFHGKGAGIRTHILVCMGSALFMLVSIYAFPEGSRHDVSRIASSVVTGIGFIGAGIIMKRKHVSGLTTAATLWVTSAIGLASGGGMYVIAVASTFVVVLCLSFLGFYKIRLGVRHMDAVISAADTSTLMKVIDSMGMSVEDFSILRQDNSYRAEIQLIVKKSESFSQLMDKLSSFPGVQLESLA